MSKNGLSFSLHHYSATNQTLSPTLLPLAPKAPGTTPSGNNIKIKKRSNDLGPTRHNPPGPQKADVSVGAP